jgi:hypothetical protein
LSEQRNLPLDREEHLLPWITYPAIEFISQFDFSKCNVFEYGSGASSHYWAERCLSIVSVESDEKWYARCSNNALPNQRLLYRDSRDSYAQAIREQGMEFEVIVIDGAHRAACAEIAPLYLTSNGMIVVDNSDAFPDVITLLRSHELIEVDFSGMGPICNTAWCTSVFLKPRFNIPRYHQDGQILITGGHRDTRNPSAGLEVVIQNRITSKAK